MTNRRDWAGLWTLGICLGLVSLTFGEAKAPRPADKQAAAAVTELMERQHLSQHRVDDTISQRYHKQFLRIFDPLKLYFLKSDIDQLDAHRNSHDEDAQNGNLGFAFDVYRLFLKRLDERAAWSNEFADAQYDFKKDDSIVLDPDSATYAATIEESKARWRTRVKFDIVSLMVGGETEAKARERVHKRYREIARRWHQLDGEELSEMSISAMTSCFDPHSNYMSPRSVEDFQIIIRQSLQGIGALLQSEDGVTIVKEIVPGGAAEKDGRLKPGDKITGVVNDRTGEMIDLTEMKLRDVVKLIRGPANSVVKLEVIPDKATKHLVYELTRQKINLQDGEAKGEMLETGKSAEGRPYRVGVIKLPSFYADEEEQEGEDGKSATNDVRRLLEDFKKKSVDAVIVDLRGNGGGLLQEAIALTGLFVDEGPIVQVKDVDGRIIRYRDPRPGVVYDGPLIVLHDKFSASASEIFAGAIQDYRRGLVVGDSSSHGKGTVQKVVDLGRRLAIAQQNMGALKLTMQQFYRPNGQSTQNRGVISDIVLPSKSDDEEFGEAKLDYALEFDQIAPAQYQTESKISRELVSQLRTLSDDRQAKEPELMKLTAQKAKAHEYRAAKGNFVFNEQKLRQQRDELKGADDEDDIEDGPANPDKKKKEKKKFGEDAYTKEVLHITSDMLRLKDAMLTAK